MDTLKIRTPEGIEFALPLAGPISRMLAFMLDLLVVMTICEVARRLLAPLGFFGKDFSDAVLIVAYFAVSMAYMMIVGVAVEGANCREKAVAAAGGRCGQGCG